MTWMRLGLVLLLASACGLSKSVARVPPAGRRLGQFIPTIDLGPCDSEICGEVGTTLVGINSQTGNDNVAAARARNQCSLLEEDTSSRVNYIQGQVLDVLNSCAGADKASCNNQLAACVQAISASAADGFLTLAIQEAYPVEGQLPPSQCLGQDPYKFVADSFEAALESATSCTQKAAAGDAFAAGMPVAQSIAKEEAAKGPGWCGNDCDTPTRENWKQIFDAIETGIGDAVNKAANACIG